MKTYHRANDQDPGIVYLGRISLSRRVPHNLLQKLHCSQSGIEPE